jgi:hypothetical protein
MTYFVYSIVPRFEKLIARQNGALFSTVKSSRLVAIVKIEANHSPLYQMI